MPRKIRSPEAPAIRRPSRLVANLVDELKSDREAGQPFIDEEHLRTGAIRVLVLWDRWDHLSTEDRTDAILDAYRLAEGEEFVRRIGLVNGLTIPEAYASGLLPFQVIAALRKGDPVTLEQCHQAMVEEGASTLLDPDRPQLRLPTEAEAEAAKARLSARLPGSEPVWQVIREAGASVDPARDVSD